MFWFRCSDVPEQDENDRDSQRDLKGVHRCRHRRQEARGEGGPYIGALVLHDQTSDRS